MFGASANFFWDNTNGRLVINAADNSMTGLDLHGVFQQYADATTNYKIIERNNGWFGFLGNSNGYFLNFDTANERVAVGESDTPPLSLFQVDGNQVIGNGYIGVAAPTNGLLVQGNVGIGTAAPSSKFMVSVNDSATSLGANNIQTGLYLNNIDLTNNN